MALAEAVELFWKIRNEGCEVGIYTGIIRKTLSRTLYEARSTTQ
jgi:hypothetical protein